MSVIVSYKEKYFFFYFLINFKSEIKFALYMKGSPEVIKNLCKLETSDNSF